MRVGLQTPILPTPADAIPAGQADEDDAAVPIHRVALLVTNVESTSDPLVLSLHAKTASDKDNKKRKRSLPRPTIPGATPPPTTFTTPGKVPKKAAVDPMEMVKPSQLTALSNLYIEDALRDKLSSKYKITVVDASEVKIALNSLMLTRDQAETPDGAQKLCTRLECDAVVAISAPSVTTSEQVTRDLVLRLDVHLAVLKDPRSGFVTPSAGKSKPRTTVPTRGKSPADFTVAGSATAYRAFLKAGYSDPFVVLSQQAAAQAASLLIHTLSTGEIAPLMKPGVRVGMCPIEGPNHADKLVLTQSGRHTEVMAVRNIPTDATGYFKPDLLPILPREIIRLPLEITSGGTTTSISAEIWRDEHNIAIPKAVVIGKARHVQYLLLARVSDVEAADASGVSGIDVLRSNGSAGETKQSPGSLSGKNTWERECRAEATGFLLRVSDGTVLWTDRGEAEITSRQKVTAADSTSALRKIVIQAEKFALIDLKRRFIEYRGLFEK